MQKRIKVEAKQSGSKEKQKIFAKMRIRLPVKKCQLGKKLGNKKT
jgi:hypothetical protein